MSQDLEIVNFLNFYLKKFLEDPISLEVDLTDMAFQEAVIDFQFHFPEATASTVQREIFRNRFLSVFLYRLVRRMHLKDYDEKKKYQIHFIMKVLCGAEIYWSADIEEGFHVDHGVGTVIGSRCKIGKGFWIHHGCTVGHKSLKDVGEGPRIGNNVIMYANSHVFGGVTIGDNTTIAANSVVIHDCSANRLVAGNPAKEIRQH